VPETPENVTAFGRPPSPDGAGTGYPHVRLGALLSLRHPLVAAAAVSSARTGELALAAGYGTCCPSTRWSSLDRGFCSYALFHALSDPTRDRHWLVRARDGRTAVRRQFGPGDTLVELQPTSITCAKHPDLPAGALRRRRLAQTVRARLAARRRASRRWTGGRDRAERVCRSARVW